MVSLPEWLTKSVEITRLMAADRKFKTQLIFTLNHFYKLILSLTLLGLTRFNNQEDVIKALRDVVIGENGCGGFWTAAKNAPVRRQSNRANSSNAVLYVSALFIMDYFSSQKILNSNSRMEITWNTRMRKSNLFRIKQKC